MSPALRGGHGLRIAWAASIVACSLAALIAGQQERSAAAALDLLIQARGADPSSSAAPRPEVDFTQSLGSPASAASLVARVHRASAANGVIVTSQAIAEREPSPSDLGRQDLKLEVRGAYPASKQLIADLLMTIDGATLRSLHIRRDPAGTNVQTSVVIAVWRSSSRSVDAIAATPQAPR